MFRLYLLILSKLMNISIHSNQDASQLLKHWNCLCDSHFMEFISYSFLRLLKTVKWVVVNSAACIHYFCKTINTGATKYCYFDTLNTTIDPLTHSHIYQWKYQTLFNANHFEFAFDSIFFLISTITIIVLTVLYIHMLFVHSISIFTFLTQRLFKWLLRTNSANTYYQYHVHSNLQQANASIMLKQHVIHLIHLLMIIHSNHSPFITISLFLKLSRSETKWRLDRSIWNHHPSIILSKFATDA